MSLRIGLVSREWQAGDCASGGIGTCMRNLAAGLVGCGVEPVVFTGPRGKTAAAHAGFDVIHLDEPPSIGAQFRRIMRHHEPSAAEGRLRVYQDRARTLRRRLPGFVKKMGIHALVAPVWGGEMAEVIASLRVPVILRASGIIRQVTRASGETPSEEDRLLHEMEARAVAGCAGLFAPTTSALRDVLTCMPVPNVPTYIIPSGVDTERFQPSGRPAPRHRFRALFAGRLEPQKGLEFLTALVPRIIERVGHFEMWMAGRDTATAPNGLTWQQHWRQTFPPHAMERCRFLTRLTWEDMPGIYQACDLLLVPSVRDNLPNVALEAMAAGLTVIAGDRSGMEEAIQTGVNGLILGLDKPEEWIERIASLADKSDTRAGIGRTARQSMQYSFSLAAMSQNVLEFCRQVVDPSLVPRESMIDAGASTGVGIT